MKRAKKWIATLLSVCLLLSAGNGVAGAIGQETETATLAEEFLNPPQQAKPNIRFWMPYAAVDRQELEQDFKTLADLGYGGVEVIGYSTMKPTEITPEYEWGTENWDRVMEWAAEFAQKYELTFSVTNGPSWPISLPSVDDADNPAASYEMTYSIVTLEAGETYDGIVPDRNKVREKGTPRLFAASAYRLAGDKTLEMDTYQNIWDCVEVDEEDHTQSTLHWTAPEDGAYEVFLYWEQPTGQQAVCVNTLSGFGATGGFPGYVVDHFGKAAADEMVAYWTDVFENKNYGKYISDLFCDSIEYQVDKEWTRGFQDLFQQQKGYDITPYLPALGEPGHYNTGEGPAYQFTDPNLAQQIKNDYNEVLTNLMIENHYTPLRELAEKYGKNLRYQVAYNKEMQIIDSAMAVDIPEIEGSSLDFMRLMASSVHMEEEKTLYSVEAAFEMIGISQTYEDIAWYLKRDWAAGINTQYLHGGAYSGMFQGEPLSKGGSWGGETTWPGWHPMAGAASNEWNRNVNEENAADYLKYFSRFNYVMQKDSKIDIAIYYDQYSSLETGIDGSNFYPDDGDLNANGYSYEFISPAILNLPSATVTNGMINMDGPAYKALIVDNKDSMDPSDIDRLRSLAKQGATLIFVGETPSKLKHFSDVVAGKTDEDVQNAIAGLLSMDTVIHVEDYADVVPALKAAGITADTVYDTPTDVLARHQVDEKGDYYYLYNYNKKGGEGTAYPNLNKDLLTEKDLTITLQGEGRPYAMNAWTGEISPIAQYTVGDGTVTLSLHFDEDEAKLIAILPDEVAKAEGLAVYDSYVTDSSVAVSYDRDGNLTLKSTEGQTVPVTLSDGRIVSVLCQDPRDAFAIDQWTLQINSMHEGKSVAFRDSEWTLLEPVTLKTLDSWKNIDADWANVVGTGTYTASFILEQGWEDGCGAFISLGEVEDTFTVAINGVELPMVDQINTTIDIGPYVKAGENSITVEVSSTIGSRDVFGMLGVDGKVTVTPYTVSRVESAVLSATAPESAQVNEDFVVSVIVDSSVTDVKLFNENDMAIGCKAVEVTENDNGTRIFNLTLSVGTVGEGRTFKVVTKGPESYYKDSGVTVSLDTTSVPASIISFDMPESAVANRTFIVTATTDLSATKIEVYNETGMKMGIKSLSSKVVDGQKVWTGVMSIGTQGDRTFSVCAVNKYGARSEALTDTISVKAFA